jgi:hypothetical protein
MQVVKDKNYILDCYALSPITAYAHANFVFEEKYTKKKWNKLRHGQGNIKKMLAILTEYMHISIMGGRHKMYTKNTFF